MREHKRAELKPNTSELKPKSAAELTPKNPELKTPELKTPELKTPALKTPELKPRILELRCVACACKSVQHTF